VPPERLWQAVSGHVNLRSHAWWCEALEAAGFRIRWREMHVFEQLRREEATFCTPLGAGNFYPDSGGALRFPGGITDQVSSWGPRNLILAEVA